MPEFKDCKGKSVMIEEWPGNSYKAKVINRAYRENKFWAVDMLGTKQTFFKCEWCKRWITSAGVQGDHVVQQKMGKSQSPEVRRLAEMLKVAMLNELSGDSRE